MIFHACAKTTHVDWLLPYLEVRWSHRRSYSFQVSCRSVQGFCSQGWSKFPLFLYLGHWLIQQVWATTQLVMKTFGWCHLTAMTCNVHQHQQTFCSDFDITFLVLSASFFLSRLANSSRSFRSLVLSLSDSSELPATSSSLAVLHISIITHLAQSFTYQQHISHKASHLAQRFTYQQLI